MEEKRVNDEKQEGRSELLRKQGFDKTLPRFDGRLGPWANPAMDVAGSSSGMNVAAKHETS